MEIVKFKSRCVRDILRTVVITTNAFARMLVVCHGCGAERERRDLGLRGKVSLAKVTKKVWGG